jgi:hypothetical protein
VVGGLWWGGGGGGGGAGGGGGIGAGPARVADCRSRIVARQPAQMAGIGGGGEAGSVGGGAGIAGALGGAQGSAGWRRAAEHVPARAARLAPGPHRARVRWRARAGRGGAW